jgi:hypothetical protein
MATPTQETFLDAADYELIGEEFRKLWNTRRLALNDPVATIMRYTTYPNPQTLSADTITHLGLSISENIVSRSMNLVEGGLDRNYAVTGYTTTSITVAGADFLAIGFTTACTFHIEGLGYQKLESPTKAQIIIVGSESLIDREVAYYNLTEEEIRRFGNELDMFDRRFVFYDIGEMENNDIIISEGQEYAVYKQKYNVTYNKVSVYGKALRKT